MNKQFSQPVKVYLAAPFFSAQQIQKVEQLEQALEKNQTVESFFSPMRCQRPEGLAPDVAQYTPAWAKATMENDVKEVDKADVIVAITDFDGQDTDSGTAWELGYAIGTGKPTYLLRYIEDLPTNIMLTERNTAFFTHPEQVERYDFLTSPSIPYDGKYH